MNNLDYIKEYIEVETSEKANTTKTYENVLNKFSSYINKDFVEVLPKDIKLYQKKISSVYAQSTLDLHVIVIKSFFNYMKENKYIDSNVGENIKLAKSSKMEDEIEKKEFLTKEEVDKLIETVRKSKGTYKAKNKDYLRARDLCILMMAFKLGLRESEIRETTLDDIDLENGKIVVDGSRRKNGDTLVLPLDEELIDTIWMYLMQRNTILRDDSNILFLTTSGRDLCNSDMNRMIKRRAEESGICSAEQIHAHVCRHTTSMILQSNGASLGQVSKILGQRSMGVTYKKYTHLDENILLEKGVSFN